MGMYGAGMGKVNSVLGKLNLRCQVKVLRRLLYVSHKYRGDREISRINVGIYNVHLEEPLPPNVPFYLGRR